MFHVFMNEQKEGIVVDANSQAAMMEAISQGLRTRGHFDTSLDALEVLLELGGRTVVGSRKMDGAKGDALARPFPCIDPEEDPVAFRRVRVINTN